MALTLAFTLFFFGIIFLFLKLALEEQNPIFKALYFLSSLLVLLYSLGIVTAISGYTELSDVDSIMANSISAVGVLFFACFALFVMQFIIWAFNLLQSRGRA